MRDKKDRSDEYRADMRTMTLTLTVSLFIALLAFFMVLNSFSASNPEKIATARSSLNNAFGFMTDGRANFDTGLPGTGAAGDQAMEEKAAEGLRSVLPDMGFESRAGSSGRMMVISIKREELNERWSPLVMKLSNLLTEKNDSHFGLQIVALDGDGESLVPLAHNLADHGVDPDLINVGFEKRGIASIELRFVSGGGR